MYVSYVHDFYYSDKSCLRYIYVTKSAMAFSWNPFFDFFKKISRDLLVTDSDSCNGFPQINIPFKFSRINYRLLFIMDGCSKCCEINTVSLTYGPFQVLPWNNGSIIEKMDRWKWFHHITDVLYACLKIRMYQNYYLWYIPATTPVQQKHSKLEKMRGCNCSFIIKRGPIIVWIAATGIAN